MSARKRLAEEDVPPQPPAKSRREVHGLNAQQTPGEVHIYTIKLYSRKKALSNDPHPHANDNNDDAHLIRSHPRERQENVRVPCAPTSTEEELSSQASETEANVKIEYVDDNYVRYDDIGCSEWLEPVNVSVTTVRGLSVGEQIGYCRAKLVRKEKIRTRFHESMRKPIFELVLLAFDLFDRYGRLIHDYKHHPVRKGSGIWGTELDRRDILLIEYVHVDERHRGQGIGVSMLGILRDVVSHKARNGDFVTIVWPESPKESRFPQIMEYLIGSSIGISIADDPDLARIK
ncbi:hypothetical protein EDD36DRAFT_460752 [Exophiala viscosa]|uniref:Uncharacterized protein n=1 Tax=Exophiala viscosa TaxID=2486360 RepID=A0AAN6E7S4_9EURO|nr:hypothetical protein EDD36DRAFT_460752 [Exophiala viscosa]